MFAEAVGHRCDLCGHRQSLPPLGWDRLGPVVGASDLAVDRGGRVGVLAEIRGQQGTVTEPWDLWNAHSAASNVSTT